MAINVKDKLVTLESLGVAYSAEQDAREEADQALSTRIDNIVVPEGDPSLTEVSDARVSGSTTYNTLKARLDADKASIGTDISQLQADLGDVRTDFNKIINNQVECNFGLKIGGFLSNGDTVPSEIRIRTGYIPVTGAVKVCMSDDTYNIKNIFAYTEAGTAATSKKSESRAGTDACVFTMADTEKRIRMSFSLASDENHHIMTNDDITAIESKLMIYTFTDKELTDDGIPADAKVVGGLINILKNASMEVYNTDNFGYAFGGLSKKGFIVPSATHALRVVDDDGDSTFFIKKDSQISVDSGYEFNVAQFAEENGMYELLDMKHMDGNDFLASQDCYIRVSVATMNRDTLWELTEEEEQQITTAGEQALQALHFDLIGQTSMGLAQHLAEDFYENSEMLTMTKPMPYTAEGYHALYDDLVEAGLIERSQPYYCSNDSEHKWPLYTYKIKKNHEWLNGSYGQHNYDGTNDLYQRKKVLIISGLHGSERATPSYLYEFINRLFNSPSNASLLITYDWTIIPLVNAWGYSHSAVNSAGKVNYGQGTPAGYTVRENNDTNKYDGGIRRNANSIDINRDFSDGSGFKTDEAAYVRDVLISEHFDYAFDFHQAYFNDNRCAFASLSYNATDEIKNKMFKSVAKAGAETDVAASADTNNQPGSQTSFPWVGSDLHTFRNYIGGYSSDGEGNIYHKDYAVDIALCCEMSTSCKPYSNSKATYNEVSLRYGNTFTNNLIKNVLTD